MASKVTVYTSSVAGSMEIKKHQQKISMILTSKKIDHETVDVAAEDGMKDKMREIMKDPAGLPPQICNGDTYCGDFEAFELAVEDGALETFLKLK